MVLCGSARVCTALAAFTLLAAGAGSAFSDADAAVSAQYATAGGRLPAGSAQSRHRRAVLATATGTSCVGCTVGYCEKFTGCSFCDDTHGYAPDGKGSCTQGTPAAALANPTNARVAASGVSRTFQLHPLLTANGVISSGTSGPVFGFGEPGDFVNVTLSTASGARIASASATVDSNGKWVASLGSLKPGTGYTLKAVRGEEQLTARNMAVGQLWLVSGQSNVFISLGDITSYGSPWKGLAEAALAQSSSDKDLRLFKVPTLQSSTPKVTVGAEWMLPNRDVVDSFSATAYLTGLELRKKLKVPVGIVQSSYGGTQIVQWLPPAVLAAMRGIPTTSRSAVKTNLFNSMISPLLDADFTGVIWYQGESDAGLTFVNPFFGFYEQLLTAMLKAWRAAFRNAELPFEIVQLPNYSSLYANSRFDRKRVVHWPFVREAQRQVALKDPLADLVSIVDLGLDVNVHPPNKWDVATRLVRAILKNRMNVRVGDTGPTFKSAGYATRKATLTFDNAAAGFVVGKKADSIGGVAKQSKSSTLTCFELYHSRAWFSAKGKLSGTKVVVTADKNIGKPTGVRYAWSDTPHCNLYSAVLLPAVPFTTDASFSVSARKTYG
jgi:sialate O-acetylesterase